MRKMIVRLEAAASVRTKKAEGPRRDWLFEARPPEMEIGR